MTAMNIRVSMDSALTPAGDTETIMASIDGDSEAEQLIIADVSRDEAWIAMPMAEAPALSHWR